MRFGWRTRRRPSPPAPTGAWPPWVGQVWQEHPHPHPNPHPSPNPSPSPNCIPTPTPSLLLRHAACERVPAAAEVPDRGWDRAARCRAVHAAQRGRVCLPGGGRAQGAAPGAGLAHGLHAERQGVRRRGAEAKGEGPEAEGGAGAGRRGRGRGARGGARGRGQASKGGDESMAAPRGAAHTIGLHLGAPPSSAAISRRARPRCVLHLHSLKGLASPLAPGPGVMRRGCARTLCLKRVKQHT